MGLESLETKLPDGPGNVITTTVDAILNWGRENSLWPIPYATACCGIEFMSTVSSAYDISRFGAEVVRFSPRQADLMIVAGTINCKQAPILKRIYDQMPSPKWVISMGVCASSGGFYDNYAVVQGIDEIIPVDVYIGGCPPRPEAVLDAVMKLQGKLQVSSVKDKNYTGDAVQPVLRAPEMPIR